MSNSRDREIPQSGEERRAPFRAVPHGDTKSAPPFLISLDAF